MDSGWETGGGGAGGSYNIGEEQENVAANNAALGEITFDELCAAITVRVTDESICLGESFTLDGTGAGEITWYGGLTDGEAFTPADAGVFTYTATSDSEADCGFSIDIEVLALPEVNASVDSDGICSGESIILTGGGADDYEWFPGIIEDGEAYTPGVGVYTYSVIGTDDAGCENTAEVEVTVYELPDVTATITDEEICLGESVTLNGGGATTYAWDAEEDGVEFTPAATGTTTYTVEGTDDNGCANEASIDLVVSDELTITFLTSDEIFGSDGEIDITVTDGNPAYAFDWDDDGVTGDFDNTEDLTGLTAGTYTVVVMCDAGCSATATATVDSQVGIDSENSITLLVYTNPKFEAVTVQFGGQFDYMLTAINGDIMISRQGVDQTEISLDGFASGIYFVTVKSQNEIKTIKLVKK